MTPVAHLSATMASMAATTSPARACHMPGVTRTTRQPRRRQKRGVKLSTDGNWASPSVLSFYTAGQAPPHMTIPTGASARYVRVQLRGTNILSLAEVQVFGCGTAGGPCSAPPSCAAIHASSPSLLSGTYTIDPDGAGPLPAAPVHCDMTIDGGGWTRFRTLNVPISSVWGSAAQVPYTNALAQLPSATRVLVKLTLDAHYAWASWDRGASAPSTWLLNFGAPIQTDGPNARSGTDTITGLPVTLHMQNWSNCYTPQPSTGLYGWGNVPTTAPCYGTFSFFSGAPGAPTIFAYDSWAYPLGTDIGIGKQPTGSPDWTFAHNAGWYTSRTIDWYVK